MRYMMCFFPFVGALIGLLVAIWVLLCSLAGFGPVLRAAGIVLIPLLVSGGIHLDGFADTCDALASNAGVERRREILKDPHTGAFAVIGIGMYLVADFAFACELDAMTCLPLLAAIPFLSRCLSGIATIAFAPGVGKGMLFEFHNSANRRNVLAALAVMTAVCTVYLMIANPAIGIGMVCAALLCLVGLYLMSENAFCGMSGDLAGFFLQLCELVMLAVLVIVARVVGLA